MRIVAIRDIVSPIRSNIANAYIDFSQMTASVVAIETDLKVEGKPVIGYGFNSNGRYAQKGLLAERFILRGPWSVLTGNFIAGTRYAETSASCPRFNRTTPIPACNRHLRSRALPKLRSPNIYDINSDRTVHRTLILADTIGQLRRFDPTAYDLVWRSFANANVRNG